MGKAGVGTGPPSKVMSTQERVQAITTTTRPSRADAKARPPVRTRSAIIYLFVPSLPTQSTNGPIVTPRDEPCCAELVIEPLCGCLPAACIIRNRRRLWLFYCHTYCDGIVATCQACMARWSGRTPLSNGRRVCNEGFSTSERAQAGTTNQLEPPPPGGGRTAGGGAHGRHPSIRRFATTQDAVLRLGWDRAGATPSKHAEWPKAVSKHAA